MTKSPSGCIDAFAVLPDGRLLVSGWAVGRVPPSAVRVVHRDLPGPVSIPCADTLGEGPTFGFLHPRPDVESAKAKAGWSSISGFAVVAELTAPVRTAKGWTIEVMAGKDAMAFPVELAAPDSAQLPSLWARVSAKSVVERLTATAPPASLAEVAVDRLVVVGRTALAQGWLIDPGQAVDAIDFVTARGSVSGDLRRTSHPMARPDVQKAFSDRAAVSADVGYVAAVSLTAPIIQGSEPPSVRLRSRSGHPPVLRPVAQVIHPQSRVDAIRAVIEPWDVHRREAPVAFARVFAPVLSEVLADPRWAVSSAAVQPEIVDFGTPPADPDLTVIVPLYGRYDFIQFQGARFAEDPDVAAGRVEILYVVDDPRIAEQCRLLSAGVHSGFGVRFRLVISPVNLGFAGANNLGARHARGRTLVLLNSDAFPTTPGWLGRMAAHLDDQPDAGIVGARLLFGDGAVQHDGMRFSRNSQFWHLWFPTHPGKGLPPMPARTGIQACPATTGACMAIHRTRYLELGGLDEGYILGDFEDADLCMKVRAQGLRCLIDHDIALHHLERMSQNLFTTVDWKFKVTLANAIRFNERWGTTLAGDRP